MRWLGAVSPGVDAAGHGRGRRVKELFLHICVLDEGARRAQQDDAVEHLQCDQPAHKQMTPWGVIS